MDIVALVVGVVAIFLRNMELALLGVSMAIVSKEFVINIFSDE